MELKSENFLTKNYGLHAPEEVYERLKRLFVKQNSYKNLFGAIQTRLAFPVYNIISNKCSNFI